MKHLLIDMDDTLIQNQKDYESIMEDSRLKYLIQQCKYPKFIYTNATFGHANTILHYMGLTHEFKKIYSRDNIPSMKPSLHSAISLEKNINQMYPNEKNQYIFFDDLLPNLKTGKKRKWITVWISPLFDTKNQFEFIDYAFPNMKLALSYLNQKRI